MNGNKELQVFVLDVGQGDMIVALPPNGQAILIDCPSYGVNTALQFLYYHQITNLGLVVISHSDEDHIGGVVDLIRSYAGSVHRIIAWPDRSGAAQTPSYRRHFLELINLLNSMNIRNMMPPTTGQFPARGPLGAVFGDVKAEILHPDYVDCLQNALSILSRNDISIVLKLTYNGRAVLLAGDLEQRGWELIYQRREPIQADILKYPHHGGYHGLIPQVLTDVNPECVILSVGTGNIYDHPKDDTIRALRTSGVRFMCTQATDRCLPNVLQARDQMRKAHAPGSFIGLGLHGGKGCPCAGTICIRLSLQGNLTVEPSAVAHDNVKNILLQAQCR